jgi:hypothetical protein
VYSNVLFSAQQMTVSSRHLLYLQQHVLKVGGQQKATTLPRTCSCLPACHIAQLHRV